MKVVAFITDYAAVDRIIDYLELTFIVENRCHRASSSRWP
jgi:hypothetical protein